jgi:hypothetical protein
MLKGTDSGGAWVLERKKGMSDHSLIGIGLYTVPEAARLTRIPVRVSGVGSPVIGTAHIKLST